MLAQEVAHAADGFEGALRVHVEDKRQGPPQLHDLSSLQKLCGSRFGWTAAKTLEVAQELNDGPLWQEYDCTIIAVLRPQFFSISVNSKVVRD